MARHNMVSIYGMISGNPYIVKDEKTGEYKKGMANIILIRNTRDAGFEDDALRYDKPMLFSGNPKMVEEMEKLKEFDVVEIKGFLTTMDIKKKTTCKECKKPNTIQGTLAFISPVFLDIRKTDSNERESLVDLKHHMEISNQILLVGNLCGDPQYYHDKSLKVSLYQLAVNRKYFLNDGRPDTRTDYPFVRSFGENAYLDYRSLQKGSCVLIDGRIQTREFERKSVCEHCGKEYIWVDNTIEAIPYSVEYLQNFLTPEDIEEQDKKELEDIKKGIFGKKDDEE